VRVSDIQLGGRVLHHDGHMSDIGEEESEHEIEPGTRNLLGAWSPPDGTTPLAAPLLGTHDEGILGLGLRLNDHIGSPDPSFPFEDPQSILSPPTATS
jgi:hypothetical protein